MGRVTVHFYLNTMLIGVGWVGAWGGACCRSLLLEHDAHWGGVGRGMGWGVYPWSMKEKNILVKGHIIGPEEWNGRGYKRSAFRGYKRSSFRGYNRCTARSITPSPQENPQNANT